MIVCGVDIKAKEANLALVTTDGDDSAFKPCSTKRLVLNDDKDSKSLEALKSAISAFAETNGVDVFVIKSRQSKGIAASGGITFKIEAMFQIAGTPVEFVSAPTLSKFSRGNRGGIPNGVLKYQEDAYRAGAWRLSQD